MNNPYTKRKQEEREEMTNNQKTREINNIEDNIMEEVDDCPLKTIGSKEWNNVALIEIEVFKLRKSMTGITDKEERVTAQKLIESYEERQIELENVMETQEVTSTTSIDMSDNEIVTEIEEEKMEIGNKRKELYSWNKLNYLNHTLKKYEVELYQSRNGSQRIQMN